MTTSVSNDFSPVSNNLVVMNPYCVPMQMNPYAANYTYPTNFVYSVPLWVQPIHSDHHKKNDDQLVAKQVENSPNMTQNNLQSTLLKSLSSNLLKFSPNSTNTEGLLQDCINGLTEYAQNFNFRFQKDSNPSRKRRRSFCGGYSSDSDFTDVDSESEDTAPTELLMLEKSLNKIQEEYTNRNSTKLATKPFSPPVTTEQNSLKSEKPLVPCKASTQQQTPKYERVNNNAPIGVDVQEDANGNTIYKIRGKPIKFKVVKGRPKNGLFHKTWEWHFEKLKDFQNRYGHTNVTRSVEGFEDIGTWVAEQRRKIKKGRITIDQFNKLNDVGFEWDRSYYFYNSQQTQQPKRLKSSSDEEVASLPDKEGLVELAPKAEVQPESSQEPVL